MIKNYFLTCLRNVLRNKTFSLINIIGLAVGVLCCLYIVIYVTDQYSYDKHYEKADDIYRITSSLRSRGDHSNMASCSPPIAPAMKQDFPEVQEFTRVVPMLDASNHLLRYKEKAFYNKKAYLVDSTFFKVFSWRFLNGNESDALSAPNSIVLSKTVADQLFDKEDPIGKTMILEDAYGKNNFKVTGVLDESPGKSNIQADMFIKMDAGGVGGDVLGNTNWVGNNFAYSYVRLRPGTNAGRLEEKLPAFLNKYGAQQLRNKGIEKQLHLQPITRIHTTTGYGAEMIKPVSSSFLRILLLIAGLIQIIACINFMNLSTARASTRAKEVGIRKVMGAGKKSLILQFLGESFLFSLLSILMALPLLFLLLPYLNGISQADIRWAAVFDYRILLLLTAIAAVTGLVAGCFPAFYLSAFNAIKVLKGNFHSQVSAAGIRRSLVVFQFVLSVVLITGIIIIYRQLDFIEHKDLGFEKNQKLVFHFYTPDARSKMQVFANDLRALPEMKGISLSNNLPGGGPYYDWSVFLQGGNDASGTEQQNLSADENFVKTMGIKLISGRDFRLHDSAAVLINEALMNRLALKPGTAPGTKLYSANQGPVYEIAGVMKDFNYQSLRDEIAPFMVVYDPAGSDIDEIVTNVTSADYKTLLGKIEALWQKDLTGEPFQYSFLDEDVQQQYQTEITLSRIINSFTLVAILISCLGIFGLAAFSAEQRKKEIGVRKVLGSTVTGIVQLLSKDFLKLTALSIVIAMPIAGWAMDKWLQNFAYRIEMEWWMFALSGIITLVVVFATVSFQAIKAAIENPVKSLRAE